MKRKNRRKRAAALRSTARLKRFLRAKDRAEVSRRAWEKGLREKPAKKPKPKKKRAPRKKAPVTISRQAIISYGHREAALAALGFSSYGEYCRSEAWAEIRERILKAAQGKCFACGRRAWQVHHRMYSEEALRGEDDAQLLALCGACHRWCEWSKQGEKLSPRAATRRLEGRRRRLLGT